MRLRPLHPDLGVEVIGFDVQSGGSAGEIAELRALLFQGARRAAQDEPRVAALAARGANRRRGLANELGAGDDQGEAGIARELLGILGAYREPHRKPRVAQDARHGGAPRAVGLRDQRGAAPVLR